MNLKIGNKTTNNYGEYLYERDKKYQEEKEKKIVLRKQKNYQEEKNSFMFKPLNNYESKLKSSSGKKDTSQDEKISNNNYYYDNYELNKYLYGSNNYRTSNRKYRENMIKNKIDKNENKSNNQKYKNNKGEINSSNNKLFYNSNNLKKNKNKIKIPYDKNRINNIHQKLFNSRIKPQMEKNHFSSSKSFSNKSFNINNSSSTMFSDEEYRNIFINLFNTINKEEKNFISGNTLNISKVPKNILVIINPIIKELLKNKNIKMNKEEFISCMNELFNNISSIDKRLIIYTYKNRSSKNNSLIINNSKSNFSQFQIRPETPDFSLKNKYNYYYNNMQKMSANNLKNNVGFQSSKSQKKVEEFLYGNNSNFYHGF